MDENELTEEVASEMVWGIDSAETAYSVIARYVEHTQISGMVIALLAGVLGEEKVRPLADNEYWQAYLAGRRSLAEAKDDIDRLTRMIERMRERES